MISARGLLPNTGSSCCSLSHRQRTLPQPALPRPPASAPLPPPEATKGVGKYSTFQYSTAILCFISACLYRVSELQQQQQQQQAQEDRSARPFRDTTMGIYVDHTGKHKTLSQAQSPAVRTAARLVDLEENPAIAPRGQTKPVTMFARTVQQRGIFIFRGGGGGEG